MPSTSPSALSRRHALAAGVALAAAPAVVVAQPRFAADPFGLGVASGEPTAGGFVLWTRVLPDPASREPLATVAYEVAWEVSERTDFATLAARGVAMAVPDDAHSLHVEVGGLKPARDYRYRFRLGGQASPTGRARTAPAPGAKVDRLDLVVASCQHHEAGWYGAWRDAVREEPGRRAPDAIVFLGDYIYEGHVGANPVRRQDGEEPKSLDDYRRRYATYKADPDLRRAHAAAPWIGTWDDHEVENDYADLVSEKDTDTATFRAQRAAAYKAWWEHMPMRRSARPAGANATIHRRLAFGDLLDLAMLDGRQYRSPLLRAVGDKPAAGDRFDPGRTMLGAAQERWLTEGFRGSRARWNLLGNQTVMAPFSSTPTGNRWRADQWDGYAAGRERLLGAMRDSRLANPVVMTGDIHAFIVADLRADRANAGPAVATEFVGTSISSGRGYPGEVVERAVLANNPHARFYATRYRGHVALTLTPATLVADLRIVENARDPNTVGRTLQRFVVEAGKPGAVAG